MWSSFFHQIILSIYISRTYRSALKTVVNGKKFSLILPLFLDIFSVNKISFAFRMTNIDFTNDENTMGRIV